MEFIKTNSLKKFAKSSESIIVFVILELLGLMCFGLGGLNNIYFVVGIIINIFSIPFLLINSTKVELKQFCLFLIPFILMSLLICFGSMYKGIGLGFNNLLSFLALISFVMIGYSARRIKSFKIETALYIIGGGLMLVTLISMLVTWFNYGLFHTIKYVDTPIYYYNGSLFDVTKESSWLLGFSISEVSLQYSGLFGFLCSLYLIGLLFINPKNDIKKFLIFLIIGLVGLISLVTVVNKMALLLLIPSYIIALLYRFVPSGKANQKRADIAFIIVMIMVFAGLFVAILNNYVPSISKIIASNRILNKFFNATYMDEVNVVLSKVFTNGYFFGVPPTLLNGEIITTNTRMFEAELLKEGGFFALFFFIIFIVFVYLSLRKYNQRTTDSKLSKIMVISIIFGLFIYSSLNFDGFYVVHNSGEYHPFFRSLTTLMMLFLVGYSFYPIFKKDVELYIDTDEFKRGIIVEDNSEKQIKKDKDYQFDEDDLNE